MIGIYAGAIILLNIPYFQHKVAAVATIELQNKLQTHVSIGRIDVGFLNRLIIEDISIEDQRNRPMLKAARMAAKVEILPLFEKKVNIRSIQLFGFNIQLSKENAKARLNCQFIIDAFKSKHPSPQKTPLNLRINEILIRRGKVSYDLFSKPYNPQKLDLNHLHVHNVRGTINLKSLTDDSINITIKRLNFTDQSGFRLNRLSMHLAGNQKGAIIQGLNIRMPHSFVKFNDIYVHYTNYHTFKQIADKVSILTHFNSLVTLSDFASFSPALSQSNKPLIINSYIKGTINDLLLNRLEIKGNGRNVNFTGDIKLHEITHPKQTKFGANIRQLYINSEGLLFVSDLLHSKLKTSSAIKHVGAIRFTGKVYGSYNYISIFGKFVTMVGNMETKVRYTNNPVTKRKNINGAIKAIHLNIGKILDKSNKFSYTDFDLHVDATLIPHSRPIIIANGLISHFSYNKYDYKNIRLNGSYTKAGFNGKISMDDTNGQISVDGSFDIENKIPRFNLKASLKNFSPNNLHLTNKMKNTEITMGLQANFIGHSIDDAIGEISIDTLHLKLPNSTYDMKRLTITAQKNGDKNNLAFHSEDLDANVEGHYSYRTIPGSFVKTIEKYLPSILNLNHNKTINTHNNFTFNIHLKKTDFINKVLNMPLTLYKQASISGYFNDDNSKIKVYGEIPSLRYGGFYLEQGRIICETPKDTLMCQLRGTTRMKNGSSLNLILDLNASNDKLTTALNWGNNTALTYSGKIEAITNFTKSPKNLKAEVKVQQSDIILGDSIWKLYPSTMKIDSGQIHINNFLIKHQDQFIKIFGATSKNNNDSIKLNLNKVDLAYLFNIINFKSVDFGGIATGEATVTNTFKSPEFNAHLNIKDFTFNQGKLGDASIYGTWDKAQNGLYLNADIHDKNSSHSQVKGYIWIPRKQLSLDIEAQNTSTKFLEYYVGSIASNIKGSATGHFRVYGGFKALNVSGNGKFDGSFKINVLNTTFALRDSIKLTENEMLLNNAKFEDMEGHSGTLSCTVYHKNFKNWNYRIQANANNMVVYNTAETNGLSFYGKLYGSGNVTLVGNTSELNINAALSPGQKTLFTYKMAQVGSLNNQFIHFVDKTPRRPTYDSLFINPMDKMVKTENENHGMDIHMTVSIDANPNATVRVIVDPRSGDYIQCTGNGNLRVDYYNKGDIKIFGTYTVDQGIYKFSLQQVIRKNFDVRQGSAITFNGDPGNANIDMNASYTVNSVSLSDLVGQEMATALQSSHSNLKVNCIMNISGALQKPNVKFSVELPNEDEEVQRIVRTYIGTDDQMNMQMLYLLSVGRFYTPEYTQTTQQSSNTMTSVLSSTLSGQLNNMLSQAVNIPNWNFGINGSTGDSGWTDLELEGMLSGRLLNNRLLINGNFGYRDNTYSTGQTNFIGDFDFQWLLNKNGDIRLKAYNKANDRYSTKTSLNTQGMGILLKKDFNSWLDLLPWRKKKTDDE